MTVHVSADVIAGVCLAASPIFIFYGQRIIKWVLALLGFIVAAYAAQIITDKLGLHSGTAQVFIVLAAGVAGAAMLLAVSKAGIFLMGASAGMLMSNFIYQLIASKSGTSTEGLRIGVVIGCALIGGLLMMYFVELLLRAVTAFVGSYMFAASCDHFIARAHPKHVASLSPSESFFSHPAAFHCGDTICYVLLSVWFVLFAVGVFYQNRDFTQQKQKKAKEEMERLYSVTSEY